MTVRVPHDAVDSEVYIKTPRGHSGIQMDPWTSSTWIKRWNSYHTPTRSPRTNSTGSNRKGPTGTSAYTRLLEDSNCSGTAAGPSGLIEDKGTMHLD